MAKPAPLFNKSRLESMFLPFNYSDNSGNRARPQENNLVAVQRGFSFVRQLLASSSGCAMTGMWSAFMAHTSVGAFFPAQAARTLSPAGPPS
jgi:hypothetical protein